MPAEKTRIAEVVFASIALTAMNSGAKAALNKAESLHQYYYGPQTPDKSPWVNPSKALSVDDAVRGPFEAFKKWTNTASEEDLWNAFLKAFRLKFSDKAHWAIAKLTTRYPHPSHAQTPPDRFSTWN